MNVEDLARAADSCEADEATHVVCRETAWMLTPPQVRALMKFASTPPWTFTESMSSLDTICAYCAAHKPTHHYDCAYAYLLAEFGIGPQLTLRAS